MKSKAVFARFCILQGAYWSFQAAMVGYYTAYVISCGMAPSTWGLIMAVNLLCSFLGSIFWGALGGSQTSRQAVFSAWQYFCRGAGLRTFLSG